MHAAAACPDAFSHPDDANLTAIPSLHLSFKPFSFLKSSALVLLLAYLPLSIEYNIGTGLRAELILASLIILFGTAKRMLTGETISLPASKSVLFLLIVPLFFYSVSLFINMLNDYYFHSPRDLIAIFSFLRMAILAFSITFLIHTNRDLLLAKYSILAGGAVSGLLGFFQVLNLFNVRSFIEAHYSKSDISNDWLVLKMRASSTFYGEPNVFAIYMGLCIILFLYMRQRSEMPRLFSICTITCLLLGLLSSASFSGVIGLSIVISLTSISRFSIKKIFIGLVSATLIACVSYYFFNEIVDKRIQEQFRGTIVPSSFLYRINSVWIPLSHIFLAHPLLGMGPNILRTDWIADNYFFDCLLRYGLVGLSSFLIAHVIILRHLSILRTLNQDYLVARNMLLLILLASISGSIYKAPKVMELFFVSLAIASARMFPECKTTALKS